MEVFEFKLTEDSIVNYWDYKNIDNVILEFISTKNDTALLENHNKYFKVEKIYKDQMDVVEELLKNPWHIIKKVGKAW